MNHYRLSESCRSLASAALAACVLLTLSASAGADFSDLHDAVQEKLPGLAEEFHSAVSERIESRRTEGSSLDEVLSSVESTLSQSSSSSTSSSGDASPSNQPAADQPSQSTGSSPSNGSATDSESPDSQETASDLRSQVSDLAIAVHDALADNHYKHETNVDVLSGILREFDLGADNSRGIAISRGGSSSSSASSSSGSGTSDTAQPSEDPASDSTGESTDDHSINNNISISLQDPDGNTKIVNLSLNVDHALSGNTLDKVENITILSNNTRSVRILSGNSRSVAIARGSLLGGGSAAAAASSSSGSGTSSAAAAAASGGVTVIRSVKDPAPAEKGPVVVSTAVEAPVKETVVQTEPVYTGDPASPILWVCLLAVGLVGMTVCTLVLSTRKKTRLPDQS